MPKKVGLDWFDKKIIEMMKENPRISAAEIARATKLSRVPIQRRINNLMASKTFKLMLVTIFSLEYSCILTISAHGSVDNIIKFLKTKEACKQIYKNSEGEKNTLICTIFAESNEDLGNIIGEIVKNPDISKVDIAKVTSIEKMIS